MATTRIKVCTLPAQGLAARAGAQILTLDVVAGVALRVVVVDTGFF